MDIYRDERVVMTLDAGGTNFVFSAIQGGKEIIESLILPSNAHDLERCLNTLIHGFSSVKALLHTAPVAISFAFPGPADYKQGIIGRLPNFPAFSSGATPLGPMLQNHFNLPVFISNDGDLFAYGEAMAGILPYINRQLRQNKAPKQYKNLLGITLGTGFGGGIVIDNKLCEGDNSSSGEIWLMRNFRHPSLFAEEGISIRAIQKEYAAASGETGCLSPKEIYQIAVGEMEGNQQAAIHAYDEMAYVIAESVANAITLIDGLVVIGGGISGAYELIIPRILELLNGNIQNTAGDAFPRLVFSVFDLESRGGLNEFLSFRMQELQIPFSDKTIKFNPDKRVGIGLSKLGTSKAIALGAYALALSRIDE